MSWLETVSERQELVLATSSKSSIPHAIVVLSMGMMNQKLLIGACLAKTTLNNIKNNNQVVVVSKNNGEYFRLKGTAKIYPSGKYFDFVYKHSKPPMPKAAIVIDIQEIFDLGNQKIIHLPE